MIYEGTRHANCWTKDSSSKYILTLSVPVLLLNSPNLSQYFSLNKFERILLLILSSFLCLINSHFLITKRLYLYVLCKEKWVLITYWEWKVNFNIPKLWVSVKCVNVIPTSSCSDAFLPASCLLPHFPSLFFITCQTVWAQHTDLHSCEVGNKIIKRHPIEKWQQS